MGAAPLHPFALALLIVSVLLAAAMRFLPVLEQWSPLSPWLLLWGLLAYAAAVGVLRKWRPNPSNSGLELQRESPADNDVTTAQRLSGVPLNGPTSFEAFRASVETALRRLANPAALSFCQLIDYLSGTLAASTLRQEAGASPQATPLVQAQILRGVLVAAIERLKPQGELPGTTAPQNLQYQILHEEYVLRRATRHIMTRHSIAEATFHRHRREAITALARHLEAQGKLLHQVRQ